MTTDAVTADFGARLEREKLEAMKELAYGASHEINNPLANIAARAQTLLRDEKHPERRRALQAIHQQTMRAHEMISDLMLFARPPAINLEPVDLGELLKSVVSSFSEECERRRIRLTLQVPDQLIQIAADAQQLEIAITAVCQNSFEAIGTEGTVELTLSKSNGGSESAILEVVDTGPGISDNVGRHLFDPFFSGRESGRGLGFGLSKCWRIVTDHGGTIAVSSGPGGGATFSIQLPKDGKPQQA